MQAKPSDRSFPTTGSLGCKLWGWVPIHDTLCPMLQDIALFYITWLLTLHGSYRRPPPFAGLGLSLGHCTDVAIGGGSSVALFRRTWSPSNRKSELHSFIMIGGHIRLCFVKWSTRATWTSLEGQVPPSSPGWVLALLWRFGIGFYCGTTCICVLFT